MKHFCLAVLLTMAAVPAATAADPPYIGKWKLNPSKSQLTHQTFTFEKTPSGDYRFDAAGFAYNFRLDGKEYPMPDGGTVSTKALSPDVWEFTFRQKGKIQAIIKLTVKGDTASSVATIPQTGGKDVIQSAVAKRISGGPGFLGKWESTEVHTVATTLELTADGAEGLTIKYPEFNSVCSGKFDGKPYPMIGAADGPKSTMAFRKTGPASFEATTFIDAKPLSIDKFTVSANGKVLTDDGTPLSKKEPVKLVYERQ